MITTLNKLKKINDFKAIELGKSMNIFNLEISKNNQQEIILNKELSYDSLDIKDTNFMSTLTLINDAKSLIRSNIRALKASSEFLHSKIKQLQKQMNAINQEKEKYNYLLDIELLALKKQKNKKQTQNLEEFVYSKFGLNALSTNDLESKGL